MKTYYLTAELDGDIETVELYANRDCDAIATGSFRVMSLAYPNVTLWAKGKITLRDDNGKVVKVMEAK